jgi:ankyrin repeat protein
VWQHFAARYGEQALCQLLLQRGANPNAATRHGGATPLHRAALAGQQAVLDLLVARHADVWVADSDGQTVAHKAAAGGHRALLQGLLARFPALAHRRDRRGRLAEQLLPVSA